MLTIILLYHNRLKLKRPPAAKKYRAMLDALYEEVNSSTKAKL